MNSGIPYFPLDCQLDEKLELIEAEFGLKGFAVVVKLWQRIYSGDGYYCEWTSEVGLLFSRRINEGYSLVSQIVEASIKRGIFCKDLFDKYQILTSRGIQLRYLEATKRRKQVLIKKDYLKLRCDQLPKNVDILGGNVDINSKNADISKQRKEENRRVKDSKEKNSNMAVVAEDIQESWQAFVEMRKSMKAPLTDKAQQIALSTLNKLAPDDYKQQSAILEQSTFNCWKGLFPLGGKKTDNTKGGNKNSSYDLQEAEEKATHEPLIYKKKG